MTAITFGDDAQELAAFIASRIPQGHNVALLAEGEEPPNSSAPVLGTDVEVVAVNHLGVHYRDLIDDPDDGAVPTGPRQLRSWESIARIHVY